MAGTYETPIILTDLNQTDTGAGSALNTGDLRRQYNFGSQNVAELSVDQTPFFRLMTKFSKLPTDDPQYKYTEARPSWHKRYAYVTGWKAWSAGSVPTTGYTENSADVSTLTPQTLNSTFAIKLQTDYKSAGNIQNVFGQSTNAISVGDSGTTPIFLLQNQLLKINTKSSATGVTLDDYFVVRVMEVQASGTAVYATVKVVRALNTSTNKYLCSFTDATTPISSTYNYANGHSADGTIAPLEHMRTYVVGTSFLEASGYPDTWKDDPYSTTYGQTQIWKTTLQMSETARATVTKIKPNEWARLWAMKLVEHKWDINYDCLFGALHTDDDGYRYTQGVIDYLLSAANVFTLNTSTKTVDDFMEDMAVLSDPRYANTNSMVFFVNTEVYHWLNKIAGYAFSNLKLGDSGSSPYAAHYTMQLDQKKKMFGIDISKISTLYGDMFVAREIALDNSPIQMMGVNMNYIKWRPLVGNGINRDTHIKVGVQTPGVDARVDLIITEGGMQFNVPEAHALWLRST
jgi:hypothetical protein